MDEADLEAVRAAWAAATQRALRAGFEIVEVHAAQGFLLNSFLSPLANQRTDAYGGSFENRLRFPMEVIREVRALWPADRPVFVRFSATD